MSAIAGLFRRDGHPVERGQVARMGESLAHRGADAHGVWSEGPVGFAQRMLWTTPESAHERQPLAHGDGAFVLTADARIDNRDELIDALGLEGRPADDELVLCAYERWREACPEKLVGDFAFAVWDRERGAVFAARDAFGVKPLYYHVSEGLFAFATEIKGLLSLAEVPRRLSRLRLGFYLEAVPLDEQTTFWEGISRLPPGHAATVERKSVSLRRYHDLDPGRELPPASDEEYAEEFRRLLTEAVRCRTRSTYAVGSTLSGGLDSSSIACTLRDLRAGPDASAPHTFSCGFDEVPESDESRFFEAVLAQGGVVPHRLRADRTSPLVARERMAWHQDEPWYGFNMYMNWAMYGAAEEAGVRIFCEGIDGDSVVGHGWVRLTELARGLRLSTLYRELSRIRENFGYGRRGLLRQYVLQRLRRSRPSTDEPLRSTIRPDFAAGLELRERLTEARNRLAEPPTVRGSQYVSLGSGVESFTLEVLDRAAGAFELTPSYPFFDRRLVEFCLALPSDQKLRQGWPRYIHRRAMEGLPDEVRWRRDKSNLGPGLVHGLLKHERELLREMVSSEDSKLAAYVDLRALRERLERLSRERRLEDASELIKVAVLGVWLSSSGLP